MATVGLPETQEVGVIDPAKTTFRLICSRRIIIWSRFYPDAPIPSLCLVAWPVTTHRRATSTVQSSVTLLAPRFVIANAQPLPQVSHRGGRGGASRGGSADAYG